MRADYHFHPNLPKKRPERCLRAIWRAIERHQMDAMVCTEHVFKDAPNAYRQLIAAKPLYRRTHIFPGAELVSGDGGGVDVIAFGREDWYDEHALLLKPFALSLEEMITYLETTDLSYYIPHPYLLKTPLKQLYRGDEAVKKFLSSVPAFEAFNGCFLHVEHVCCSKPLRRMTRRLTQNLQESSRLDPERIPDGTFRFLAVGSDAHHPKEIGLAVDMPCDDVSSRENVFTCITSNTDIGSIVVPPQLRPLMRTLSAGWITYKEGRIRRRIKQRKLPRSNRKPAAEMQLAPARLTALKKLRMKMLRSSRRRETVRQ